MINASLLPLAWYLLWCHILVYSRRWLMPRSTHRRQLSDRLPFIRVTSLCYLITFRRPVQVWEVSSRNLKSPSFPSSQNKGKTLMRHILACLPHLQGLARTANSYQSKYLLNHAVNKFGLPFLWISSVYLVVLVRPGLSQYIFERQC